MPFSVVGSPADDFIIGDRVYVAGNKPGIIAYLGEVKFSTGDWAGVVLGNAKFTITESIGIYRPANVCCALPCR